MLKYSHSSKSRSTSITSLPTKIKRSLSTATTTAKKAPTKPRKVKEATTTATTTTSTTSSSKTMKTKPDTKSTTAEPKTTTRRTKGTLKVESDEVPITDEAVTPKIKRASTKKIEDNGDDDSSPLVRKTSSKKGNFTVTTEHLNMKYNDQLEELTRKMTTKDDHDNKTFQKQKEFDDAAKSNDNLVLTSWNVAGFRGSVKNGIWQKIKEFERKPDILCLQEMKISQDVLNGLPANDYSTPMSELGYEAVYNLGSQAGYSGVGVWYQPNKIKPLSYRNDSGYAYPLQLIQPPPSQTNTLAKFFTPPTPKPLINPTTTTTPPPAKELDIDTIQRIAEITGDIVTNDMRTAVWNCISTEGRIITVDFGSFYLITTYVPNSGSELDRLSFRHQVYEPVILEYLLLLQEQKPVMYSGDLNSVRHPIDAYKPSTCQKSAGFQAEERERLNRLFINTGLKDSFREFQGMEVHGYTYWGHRFNGRANDKGWRIDYWIVSESIHNHIKGSMVTDEYKPHTDGRISDHAPLWVSYGPAIMPQKH